MKKNTTLRTSVNLDQKLEQIQLLEKKLELKKKLPHLHGFKLYKWQREYIESWQGDLGSKASLLCAGNQIGKSSCNLIRMIKLATEPSLWPKYFPKRKPIQFWSLMPTKDLITTEFRSKLVPEFLPKDEYKKHPQYGWEAEIRHKHLWAIHFATGVSVYMHTYEQDVHHLQAGTVDAMFVDEEPPWELMPELLMRLAATNSNAGFNAVMTPTRGQEYWRRAFEVRGEGEVFPGAFKRQISIYDAKFFEDGTPSHWTDERINQMINSLGTQQEVDLRIYGRFVAQEGLKLPSFSRTENIKKPEPLPKDWLLYSGVDIGSGGGSHPPAIVFTAVSPDFKQGRVIASWKGSEMKTYTATDVLDKYIELREGREMAGEFYDWAAKDFGTVALRTGVGFQPAEKSHEIGFPMMNTLFKNKMLIIDDTESNQDLINEILNLRHGTKKNHAVDDVTDACRYCITKIPWDFSGISGERIIQQPKPVLTDIDRRMGKTLHQEESWAIEDEINEWNELIDMNYDW